jgi:hypothetical protein
MLAMALAEVGKITEAERVAKSSIAAPGSGTLPDVANYFLFARSLALAGHAELATKWADEGAAAASAVRGRALARISRPAAMKMRDAVYADVQRAERQGGAQLFTAAALPDRVFQEPPWPSVAGGRLLFWPEDQYSRLVRQVPTLTSFLGSSWQDHVGLVEAALRADHHDLAGAAARKATMVVAGDVDAFIAFLLRAGADPRDPAAMTANAAEVPENRAWAWPPRPRKPCWCGAGRRYSECCGVR